LFNQIVSARVEAGNWKLPLTGDLMMLSGSHSVFQITIVDEEIKRRVTDGDISPAAPLWGKGKELITEQALEIQNQALAPWGDWCKGLESHGLQKLYRAMVLMPHDLQLQNNVFSFTLPAGAYATTVLRELIQNEL
jgi:tRNA pseudouridine13 synthase